MSRTWVKKVRCLLSQARLPRSFWGEALNTVVHVLNLSHSVLLWFDVPNRVWIGKDVSFDARPLCTFPKMKGLSLKTR